MQAPTWAEIGLVGVPAGCATSLRPRGYVELRATAWTEKHINGSIEIGLPPTTNMERIDMTNIIEIAKANGARTVAGPAGRKHDWIAMTEAQLRSTVKQVCAPLVEALGKVIAANPTIDMSKPDAFKYISSVELSRKTLANYRTLIGDKE